MDYSEIFKNDSESDVAIAESVRIREPKRYGVILLNDDYTTADFVVEVLMNFFHKSQEEATVLMKTVHIKGSAMVGIYSLDIAQTLIQLTVQSARKNGFPLMCKLQEM
jgi:ATP-dependent Clp protease adaptor protein ClpS